MAKDSPRIPRLRALAGGGVLIAPGLAGAHAGDHLHFWGSHGAQGQGWLLGGALLALAAIGWWAWQRR